MKYEESRDFISDIRITSTETGNYIEVVENGSYTVGFVFEHKSLYDSIDNTAKDVSVAINKVIKEEWKWIIEKKVK